MWTGIRTNYQHTVNACFIGYVVQAIVNNFAPLLFVTLSSEYGIGLDQISLLITINFGMQLLIDFVSPFFIDRIGYKASAVLAHLFAMAGLLMFSFLPERMESHYIGLLVSVCVYAMGGGLLEVLISPIVEACPTKRKDAAMSLLHSFYCWGHAGVVILSTVYFAVFGVEHWRLLACLWALLPLANLLYFLLVPVPTLEPEGERSTGKGLFTNPLFWVMLLLMLCAGASEQGVSQWASTFAETGLGISKTMGDLAGPLAFALLMGLGRLVYAKGSEKLHLSRYMTFCGLLCLVCYLVIALSSNALLSLIGCAVCGFSVGVLWPGTFSIAAETIRGGTALFAYLAFAGDLGCGAGPGLVGLVAERAGGNLQSGILAGTLFPLLLLAGLLLAGRFAAKEAGKKA